MKTKTHDDHTKPTTKPNANAKATATATAKAKAKAKAKTKPKKKDWVDKAVLVTTAVPIDARLATATAHQWALTRPIAELPEMLESVAATIRDIGAAKIMTVSLALEAVDDATITVYYDGEEYWARRQADGH